MSGFVLRWGWFGALLVAAFATTNEAGAGQARSARPARGQAVVELSEEDAKIEAMSIEELRTFQGYHYVSGGRDPLTMRLPTSNELGLDKKSTRSKVAPTIAEMEKFLAKALENVIAALKIMDYEAAIKVSGDAIYTIDNEWPPLKPEPAHLPRMSDEIRNYNRMAVRLKTMKDTQTEFEAMHIRVEGIVWSPSDAKAVVNGKLLAAGEVMLAERRQGDLRIEIIEEHGVVFQFKGLRFRIPVEIYTPPAPESKTK